MVRHHEMTDQVWARIAPLLPEGGRRNGRWREHRQVLDGMHWKLATGAPWRDIPERYGPWKTWDERLRRWTADGRWDRTLAHVQVHNAGAPVEWTVHVDSTSIRTHQHAAGARKKGAPRSRAGHLAGQRARSRRTPGEALGRSRGGLTTKLHLAANGRGRPLTIALTEGQAGDNPQRMSLPDALHWRTGRPGRPRRRPDRVVDDRAYSHRSTRAESHRRGIPHPIPQKCDQRA